MSNVSKDVAPRNHDEHGWSWSRLRNDVEHMGIAHGDTVMVHAGLRSVGRIAGGAHALLAAMLDAVGPDGTLMAYTDWDADCDSLLNVDGTVPAMWRDRISPFDARSSRAARSNGALVELVRA